MANDFYTRSFNPLPGQRVDEQVLKDEFQLIQQAFDEVEDEADTLAARAIKIPESSPDQTLAFSAVQRANLVLAFDASGNITAVSKGRWRGDWVTATDYVIGDSFRYAPTGNIYSTVEAHTSGVFATDLAANKFTLAVDVETVTVASAAAVAAAATATTQAGIATTGASTATTQAGISTAAATAAAASYDSFDDRYLGPKAADPTLDNDGNALLTGALYVNTTVVPNEMRFYDGAAWQIAYIPASNYVTLSGVQTLTNKTIDGLLNTVTNVTSTRLTRAARTSNTILGAADNSKWIDVTSGTFTQTSDTAVNLGAGWWCELGNSGTGVVTYGTLAIYQGQRYRIHSDGTTIRTTPLAHQGAMVARDEKTTGTNGGGSTASTWVQRDLNTTVSNSISGASVASNQVTLPAGTYLIRCTAPAANAATLHQARLYNTTASAVALLGSSERVPAGTTNRSAIDGLITIATTSTFRLEHWTSATVSTTGFGYATSSGAAEVYSEIVVEKVG